MSAISHHVSAVATLPAPFVLESGRGLAKLHLAYESYGRLSRNRDNVILLCHALTGSAAAGPGPDGRAGWWVELIGPGRALDTDHYHILCSNIIGSCYGSTGPGSINPETGIPYGNDFPAVTIRDMVRAQRLLLNHLGIGRVHCVIGGSMGGMQVLEWGLLFPDDVGLLIPIATAAQHSPWALAFNAIAREAIALGAAAGDVAAGLRLARKVAMMTYRSPQEFAERFGRTTSDTPSDRNGVHPDGTFAVESWLEHHGQRLAQRFTPESFNAITRAMDCHDVARGRGSLRHALGAIAQPTLCIGISSDQLYPPEEQQQIAQLIPNSRYAQINSASGHDAFLIEFAQLQKIMGEFLKSHPASRCPSSRCQSHTTTSINNNHSTSITR
ncbi:MAG: homoserine O-acetyltransferase [Armatimonadetes bacterium]|nr:homoserine O-acetyltransferase [Armatimonadota bacterium]